MGNIVFFAAGEFYLSGFQCGRMICQNGLPVCRFPHSILSFHFLLRQPTIKNQLLGYSIIHIFCLISTFMYFMGCVCIYKPIVPSHISTPPVQYDIPKQQLSLTNTVSAYFPPDDFKENKKVDYCLHSQVNSLQPVRFATLQDFVRQKQQIISLAFLNSRLLTPQSLLLGSFIGSGTKPLSIMGLYDREL